MAHAPVKHAARVADTYPMASGRTSTIPLLVALVSTVAIDLVSKVLAIRDPWLFGPGIVYNPSTSHLATRIGICLASIAVVALMARLARWRGIGPIPLVWAACGILVGAVIAQGASTVIWEAGVPDFIWLGDWVWNLADFSIGIGMLSFLAASVGYAVNAFARNANDTPTGSAP